MIGEAPSSSVVTKGEEGIERYGEGEAFDRCDERDQHVELSYLKKTREVDARTISRGIMFISEPIDTSSVWKPA